jgi:hypothetical protein
MPLEKSLCPPALLATKMVKKRQSGITDTDSDRSNSANISMEGSEEDVFLKYILLIFVLQRRFESNESIVGSVQQTLVEDGMI